MNKKQKLRSQCDKLWFELLLKEHCEVCNKPAVQVHHFYFKSSYGALRFDLDNGISLCQKCHYVLHTQDPKKIEMEIIEKRGKKWADRLEKKSRERPKPSYQTILYYNEQIERLNDQKRD